LGVALLRFYKLDLRANVRVTDNAIDRALK
jgi:hypothetical protein